MKSWAPDIFQYIDFRAFLADYYDAAKEHLPAFSYRYFSRKAGYTSPNFLKLVIEGKRNLSNDSVERFGKALKLTESQQLFFADLVAFDQAQTPQDKNDAFERVAARKRFRRARRLDSALFTYLSHWYYPAIREMAARADFQEDPKWIAAELIPPIKPAQAKRALKLLLELGMLVRNEDGRLDRGQVSLTTGHEVRSLAIGNYHRQMLQRAADSIELVPSHQRDISALTVCISPQRIAQFKERIHAFRETLLDLGDSDEDPSCVYQLNIQFFPLNTVHHNPEDPEQD